MKNHAILLGGVIFLSLNEISENTALRLKTKGKCGMI